MCSVPPFFLLSLLACSSPRPQQPVPQRSLLHITADTVLQMNLRDTQWGIEVLDQSNNQVIFSENTYRHFVPASNTKLVVTTVAMGTLGPDWRYQTPFYLGGAPGDTAPTSLLIVGRGDPTMSGRFHNRDDFAAVKMLADSLVARGVKRISGDIIVDATYFTPEAVHSSWEIGDLPWYYAAPTAAFGIGEAALRLIVAPGATVGAPAKASVVGSEIPMPLVMRATTDTAGASSTINVDYEAWPDTLVITGKVAVNKADSSWIAVPDPALFAAQSLRTALAQKGVRTTGNVRVVRDSLEASQIRSAYTTTPAVTWTSPPMRDIIAAILKPSQNWIAEQLVRTLGAQYRGRGSWSAGLNVERRYLIDVAGIDSTFFSLRDASGLSAQNLLSPRAFIMLLEHARKAPWSADYRAALPTPGMRGATLSNRLAGFEQNVFAKTGSIANVNTLSGYVRTLDGRDLTFTILSNGSGRPSAEVRRGIDKLVSAMVRDRKQP